MEPSGQLLVEQRGRVLLLTLSDPQTRNALHPGIYRAGIEAINRARDDPRIGAVVLTGQQGTFSSGGNLNRLIHNREQPRSVQYDSITLFHEWIRAIRHCPQPVLAAVEGSAAGAGFSLALACDLLVAAEDARFVMAYVRVGLSPDGGASLWLARGLTPHLLAEILLTGKPLSAVRLQQLGVVNRLCVPGQVLTETLSWANSLAAGPGFAMAHIKRLAESAFHPALDTQLEAERAAFLECLYHPQCGEGITAFLEKRPPDFGSLEN
jgi:enoyl-CoA hydratase/carnithine racemase